MPLASGLPNRKLQSGQEEPGQERDDEHSLAEASERGVRGEQDRRERSSILQTRDMGPPKPADVP